MSDAVKTTHESAKHRLYFWLCDRQPDLTKDQRNTLAVEALAATESEGSSLSGVLWAELAKLWLKAQRVDPT